jgi:predicted RNA-binding protein with PIN domain
MQVRREVLIDAYNVMFAHPRIGPLLRRDLGLARDEFLALVAQRQPNDGSRMVVVFDAKREPATPTGVGRKGVGYRGGVHVVFAPDSADAWIQNRIRESEEPGTITIVTSDREILETARAHGAGAWRVADFLQLAARRQERLRELRETEKPMHQSQREIAEWEKLFEEKPHDEDEE